jgi:hypothetical protein
MLFHIIMNSCVGNFIVEKYSGLHSAFIVLYTPGKFAVVAVAEPISAGCCRISALEIPPNERNL